MKKLALLLLASGSLLSGCVVYDGPYRDGGAYHADRDRNHDRDRGHDERRRDRDGDGVSDRQDRHPNDPRR